MYRLPENEDCNGECYKNRPADEDSREFRKKGYEACTKRVNLRGVMVKPCHKLFILSREEGQLNYYLNKYFMFRN